MDNIKLLRRMGMTEYEARAYLSLAKLGPSNVREIVLESKLPRNKAYESLQRLEEKGKIVSLPVSPRKYKVSGSESLREDIEEMKSSVSDLIKMIEQPKAAEFRELFWVIRGKKAIQEKLSEESRKAKKEILSCNRLSRILHNNIRTMKDAVDRGVNVKMICTFEKNKIPSYKAWMKTGAQIRVFNERLFGPLLPRMSVNDSRVARITIGRPEVTRDEDYITLWTDSKAFSLMIRSHFINMWKNCRPIENYIKKYGK